MSIELKIKSKHLSLESGVIRFEERKLKKKIDNAERKQKYLEAANAAKKLNEINFHRRWDVRNENRATFLARAFIAGKDYRTVEQKRKPENECKFNQRIIPRIVSMVQKYGKPADQYISKVEIEDWSKL